jgi:hypothetical protein
MKQRILDCLAKYDRLVSSAELAGQLEHGEAGIIRFLFDLKNEGWVDEIDNKYTLSEASKKRLKEQQDVEAAKVKRERLEMEKLETDLDLAKKTQKDYPYTKWMARIAFAVSLVLAIVELKSCAAQ